MSEYKKAFLGLCGLVLWAIAMYIFKYEVLTAATLGQIPTDAFFTVLVALGSGFLLLSIYIKFLLMVIAREFRLIDETEENA